jgi:DNA-binding SARP family transcriptional activator
VHAGAPQTRQRIAALFWPDSTDAQALTNLRRELHNLRHALAGSLSHGDGAGPVLARRRCVHVDLRVFCR